MKRFGILYLIFFVCFSGNVAIAQSNSALEVSLEEAIQMAKANNEMLKISEEKLERVHQKYREIRAEALPQLEGSVSWNHYFMAPKITLPGQNGAPSTQLSIKRDFDFEAQANVSQVLWAFGRVRNAINAADRAIQVEQFSKELAEDDLIFQTKSAFFNALLARQALEIVTASQENARQNQQSVRKRYRGGRVSRFDHVKMASDLAARKPIVLNAQKDFQLALNTLKAVLGLSGETEISLKGEFKGAFGQYNAVRLRADLLKENPGLLSLRESVELYGNLATNQKRSFLPTLEGVASYSYSGDGDDFYIGKSNMFSTLTAGLMLRVPIWEGGAKSGRYRQALADQRIAMLELSQAEREMEKELDSALAEFSSQKETLVAQEESVKLARQSYELAKGSAATGKASQTEVNDAELRWTNAQLSLGVTVFSLHVLEARIEYLTSQRNS